MKKIIPFSKEHLLACADELVTREDYRQLLYDVTEAAFRFQETGTIEETDLDAFRAAMSCPNENVWTRTGRWLYDISKVDSGILDFVRELIAAPRAETRLAMCSEL